MHKVLPLALALVPVALCAQSDERAASCFWGIDFELGLPLDWEVTLVERQTPEGVGLGEFVPAFTIGTAAEANAGGFFPVADLPIGNHFVMANDDAAPCNCNMSDVSLTTGAIDLTGRSNVVLECRTFHEQTLGSGDVRIEASTNGTDWTEIGIVPALSGAWRNLWLDLSGYDDTPLFKLRFRWSDGGNWSSGFAVDDICLRERVTTDVSVIDVQLHDLESDPFNAAADDLKYTLLPLEQVRPLTVSVVVMNRGLSAVPTVGADVTVLLNGTAQGTFSANTLTELAPGARDTLVITTGWSAATTGAVQADVALSLPVTDEDPSDNSGSVEMRITGPGWEDRYSAMAVDDGVVQGNIGTEENFIIANRMEIVNPGSHALGVSAVLGVDSQEGEVVRGYLFDANLALVDTSLRDTLSQAEIDLGFGGAPIFLPFSSTPELVPGDYFVGLQRLAGEGRVSVATSGTCRPGTTLFMTGISFDVSWVNVTPMVRLHLTELGVGMAETRRPADALVVFPQPADARVNVRVDDASKQALLRILSATGTVLFEQTMSGTGILSLDTSTLSNGLYVLQLVDGQRMSTQRLIIGR